ncbi:MAG TPA: toll/interleukin-1 receptor domain-containing protein [Planctomycetota bacterium]
MSTDLGPESKAVEDLIIHFLDYVDSELKKHDPGYGQRAIAVRDMPEHLKKLLLLSPVRSLVILGVRSGSGYSPHEIATPLDELFLQLSSEGRVRLDAHRLNVLATGRANGERKVVAVAPSTLPQASLHASFDVFLSHSSKDKAVVRPLAKRLRADGLRVWFDEWEINPGDSIPAKIEEGLEHSRMLVLFMSENAFGSDWASLEYQTFRFRDPINKHRRFIPLRLDHAPIKGSLNQFHYIDWSTENRENAYTTLLHACRSPEESRVTNSMKAQRAMLTGDMFRPSKTRHVDNRITGTFEDWQTAWGNVCWLYKEFAYRREHFGSAAGEEQWNDLATLTASQKALSRHTGATQSEIEDRSAHLNLLMGYWRTEPLHCDIAKEYDGISASYRNGSLPADDAAWDVLRVLHRHWPQRDKPEFPEYAPPRACADDEFRTRLLSQQRSDIKLVSASVARLEMYIQNQQEFVNRRQSENRDNVEDRKWYQEHAALRAILTFNKRQSQNTGTSAPIAGMPSASQTGISAVRASAGVLDTPPAAETNNVAASPPKTIQTKKRKVAKAQKRMKIPKEVETQVLTMSKRRCCFCSGLHNDYSEKRGQIAHLDGNPSNNDPANLAFLCQPHHDEYDAKYTQTKNLTVHEAKEYRRALYSALLKPSTTPAQNERPTNALGPLLAILEHAVGEENSAQMPTEIEAVCMRFVTLVRSKQIRVTRSICQGRDVSDLMVGCGLLPNQAQAVEAFQRLAVAAERLGFKLPSDDPAE